MVDLAARRHALVTGAGGMSGALAVDELLRRGWRVTAVVGRTPGRMSGREPNDALRVVSVDLARTPPPLDGVEAVVHAAARSPGPGVDTAALVRDNVSAAANLAGACSGAVRTIVFLSSLSVFGRITAPVVDETAPRLDPDTYGQAKWLAERLLEEATGNFRLLSLRLPGIIGPGAGRNWLSRVFAAARAGEIIRVVNPDAPFNNAVHARDLAVFVADLLEAPWSGREMVTLAANGSTTIRRAVELIVRGCGGRSRVEIGEGGRPSFTVSSERARTLYGYHPMDIEEMLSLYVERECD